MSQKSKSKINKQIIDWKIHLRNELITFFKRLSVYLLIVSIIGILAHILLPQGNYTNENTLIVHGECLSVSTESIGVGSKKISSVLLELDNGVTYNIAPSLLQMTESELESTFNGATLTIRIESSNSTRILELSDASSVYHSLADTNETNQYNRFVFFCFFAFFVVLFLAILVIPLFPLSSIVFLKALQKEANHFN